MACRKHAGSMQMTRHKGSLDKGRRKSRRDKGKKRKVYNGKPTSKSKRIKFSRTGGHKTSLKLYFWEIRQMSDEGYHRWNPSLRVKVSKTIYKPLFRLDINVADIDTREKIKQLAIDIIGREGLFRLKGLSKSLRSKRGCKWVPLIDVSIKEYSEGLKAKIERDHRMFRYKWFWKG